MYGREELHDYPMVGWEAYNKEEADKVMDNLEAQVKNLQNANAELIKRVQELEDECNELESQLPKWVSTSDRLPTKEDTDCHDLVWVSHNGFVGYCDYKYVDLYQMWMNMRAPQPPTTEEK